MGAAAVMGLALARLHWQFDLVRVAAFLAY